MRVLADPILQDAARIVDAAEQTTHAHRFRVLAGLAALEAELAQARALLAAAAGTPQDAEPEPARKGRAR